MLLLLELLELAFGAISKWKKKTQLSITAENNYQRAFHDLSFHIDQIEDEIGKTLAMNSQKNAHTCSC